MFVGLSIMQQSFHGLPTAWTPGTHLFVIAALFLLVVLLCRCFLLLRLLCLFLLRPRLFSHWSLQDFENFFVGDFVVGLEFLNV